MSLNSKKKMLVTYAGNTEEIIKLKKQITSLSSTVDHLYVKLGQPGLMYKIKDKYNGPIDFINEFADKKNLTFFSNMVPLVNHLGEHYYINDMFFEGWRLYLDNPKCKRLLDFCLPVHGKRSNLYFDLLLGEWNDTKDLIYSLIQNHPVKDATFLTYYGKDVSKGSWSDYVMKPKQHTAETFISGSQIRCSDLIDPNIYNQTFYSVMVETVLDSTFAMFSEKEAKPMVSGRPFIIFGSPGHLKAFRKLGFKSFSPVIDESYDDEVDMQKRFTMVLNSMYDLSKKDPLEVYNKLADILSHNKKHFENHEWNKEFKLAQDECR
jgi:hypothetical protein